MARYKPYPHDQVVMIPVSLQEQLEPGALEYTLRSKAKVDVIRLGSQYW